MREFIFILYTFLIEIKNGQKDCCEVYLRTHRVRGQLKCDGSRAETIFRLSEKRTSPFKSAGASVQSTTGSRGVHISGSNVGYTMFRDSVKCTGYPLHSPVSLSLPLPCVTLCHHISTGIYKWFSRGTYVTCVYSRIVLVSRKSKSVNGKVTFLHFQPVPRREHCLRYKDQSWREVLLLRIGFL